MEIRGRITRAEIIRWLIALAVFVVTAFIVGIFVTFLLAAIFAILTWKVDYRAAIVASIVLLVICPLLIILGLNSTANALADWAFYLVAVAIVIQVFDYMKASGPRQDDEPFETEPED